MIKACMKEIVIVKRECDSFIVMDEDSSMQVTDCHCDGCDDESMHR